MNYNYGNTAYEYEYDYEYEWQQEQEQKQQQRRKRRQLRELNSRTRRAVAYMVIAGMAFTFMIAKSVAVSDTEKQIKNLTAELAQQQAYTSEKAFELEQKVSLTEIENIAYARLGMQRPEKTQIVYVDIKKEDCTERTVQEVEGMKTRMGTAVKNTFNTVKNIFTLN